MKTSNKRELMRKPLFVMLFLLTSFVAYAQSPDPNFHIYLAFGQSNMEGQGPTENQDLVPPERFFVLWSANDCTINNLGERKKGEWYPALTPLSHNLGAKMGVAEYFGRTLENYLNPQIRIGIIVVAVAGASIQLFDKDNYASYAQNQQNWMTQRINAYGGNPYGRLIEMAKEAQKVGVIKGIIMHQGETDADDSNWPSKVKSVYDNIMIDLDQRTPIPLLAGEVSRCGISSSANQNIAKLPIKSNNFYVVSSEGYNQTLNDGQNTHFTSQEYRDFGKRYADKMIEVLGNALNPVASISTGISSQPTVINDNRIYNLNGQQVKSMEKGIYITNGRKVIMK